jgi:co-chaperonin GroES (HSP10)
VTDLLEFVSRETPERDPAALAGLRRRMLFDFVLCTAAKLDRSARTVGDLMLPVMYQITGSVHDRDKLFIGEALDVGPGQTVGGAHEAVCVTPGDVFLCNLHNLSYRLPERGRQVYQVRNGVIYATLERRVVEESDDEAISDILGANRGPKETFTVKPVQDLILVKKNDARALAHQSGGPIWLPTERMSTDDVRSSAIVLEYGEVVSVGPGRYRDGQWSQPPCKVGDLVLYDASYSTLPVTIRGESFTLVPTPQLAQIADEAP